MISLRPYQTDGVNAIRVAFRKFRRVLYVLGTGGGKTRIFSYIAHNASLRGKRIVILCHRTELVDQIVEALNDLDVAPDIVAAGYQRRRSPVIVASVFTLVRRLDDIPEPDLIVVDECHHCSSGTTWSVIIKAWPNARVLGVTATPLRMDGRGLAETFQTLICGPSLSWLTEHGYLAPAKIFAPPIMDLSGLHTRMGDYIASELESLVDVPSITGSALHEWRERGHERPALAFCVSIKHAEAVAAQFRAAGIAAVSFSGKTDRGLRRQIVSDFRTGSIRVLAQCDLANEGFDVPGVHVGLMLRPTQSLGLWRQQLGRILRPCEGKSEAIILDCSGNTLKFGGPIDEPEWQLTYDESARRKKPRALSVRVCPKCWSANRAGAPVCTNCGTEFPVQPREVEEREGELQEITPEMLARRRERRMQGRAQTLEQLQEFGRSKGWHPRAAMYIWEARQRKLLGKQNHAQLEHGDERSGSDGADIAGAQQG